ncbi:mucin-13 [Xenopus tropicalis]|uniref:Mucin-13 n=3 Tax=Xenopus tropicalis TaxID=8364 RepID=A0A8J1IUV3_XENTR|nr:mucin-13 [Xenopus tropicalis]
MKPHLLVCALLLSLLAQTESESTTAESGTSTVTGATTESVSDPTTIATEPSTIATESTIKATEPSTIATESTIKATESTINATESTVNATESTVNATESTVNATRDPSNVTEPSYNVTTPAETNVTGGGAGSTAKPELTGTTTAPPAPDKKTCSATSCGKSFATCIQLYNSFVCQCPLNYYFNETELICIQGDAFYGNLELSAEAFNPKKDSPGYTAVYNQVLTHFRDCFKNNTNYSDTIITDISAPKPKVQSRSSRNSVPVSVRCFHVFVPKAVTEKEVLEAINTYNNGTNLLGTYSSKSVCDGFYCDAETTTCTQTDSKPPCVRAKQDSTLPPPHSRPTRPAEAVTPSVGISPESNVHRRGPQASPSVGASRVIRKPLLVLVKSASLVTRGRAVQTISC